MGEIEKFVDARMKENKKIFSEKEYELTIKNKELTKKVYILGALDGYKAIK